jgi:histone deacetylase 11
MDTHAKSAIDCPLEFCSGAAEDEYLSRLEPALARAFSEFEADLVVYNAGTDVIDGDPLGCLCLSKSAVVRRDALVFEHALRAGVPITMLLSGGYSQKPPSHAVVSASLINLIRTFDLLGPWRPV